MADSDVASASLASGLLVAMYEQMCRMRSFDQRVWDLFREGSLRGTAHSYAGMEAIGAGVGAALRPDDYITSNHRGHGHSIAKGLDLRRMAAEICGKEAGYCRGKGGSMHITEISRGMLGANGIVGAGIPIALGAAIAARVRKTGRVAVAFFGDGAANQGVFHETLNMAALWRAPMVFVCENNQIALSTPFTQATSVAHIADRSAGYGIPGATVDGIDAGAVYVAAQQAIDRARSGGGPTLLECVAYRWTSHSVVTVLDRRDPAEIQEWKRKDPIERLGRYLVEERGASSEQLAGIRQQAAAEVKAAFEFGFVSEPAPLSAVEEDVYA